MSVEKWKILLSPLGSWGDVHPFVWIGKLLASRGYDVTALVGTPFEDAMRHVGVKTIPIGNSEAFEEMARHPDLWHPRRAFEVVARGILDNSKPVIDILRRENIPGRTLLISAGISFGARIAAEASAIPQITIQLQPSAFIAPANPSLMAAGLEWIACIPYPLRYILFQMMHWHLDSILKSEVNSLRHAEGLTGNVSRIMRDYWMSPQGVLATFPEWFAKKEPDWPPQTVVTRFPLYDEQDRIDCPPELDAFLSSGPPPLLFTPGTANTEAAAFFREAAQACALLRRRGLFVTRYPEQVPPALPETIKTFSFVPFSHVFPRCAAVIHHGGIGTSAQALAAGVPHLVMAMSHDQPDNGRRLRRLGVGDYVYPRRFRAQKIASILDYLTTDKTVAASCEKYSRLMREQMSEDEFVNKIETLARNAGLPR